MIQIAISEFNAEARSAFMLKLTAIPRAHQCRPAAASLANRPGRISVVDVLTPNIRSARYDVDTGEIRLIHADERLMMTSAATSWGGEIRNHLNSIHALNDEATHISHRLLVARQ